jgi:hypothetical protein
MMRIPRLVQVSDVQVRIHRDHVHVVLVPAETEFRKREFYSQFVDLSRSVMSRSGYIVITSTLSLFLHQQVKQSLEKRDFLLFICRVFKKYKFA